MGLSINPFDWFSSQGSLDLEHGDKVLSAYFDSASMFPNNFRFQSYNEYRAAIGGDNIVKALGANVRANAKPGLLDLVYFPYDDAVKRVQMLATDTDGRANIKQINQAAIDTSVDPIEALSRGASSAIASTGTIVKYAPYIAIGVAGLVGYLWYKSQSTVLKRVLR